MNLKLRSQFNNYSFNDIYTSSKSYFIFQFFYFKFLHREYEYHRKKINEIYREPSPYSLVPINDPFAISNFEAHNFSRKSKTRGFFQAKHNSPLIKN